jgi:hypothetical protein
VDTVFKMSIMTEESLKSFNKDFGKNGLEKVPNENVRLITFQVDGVAKCLADSSLLCFESLTQYVEGFTYCSVPKFKMVFVNKSVEYTYLDAMGGSSLASMSSSNVLLKIKEISCAAVAIYVPLQLGKKWNLPGKHVNNAVIVPKCDNCGNPNHFSPKCPKPCNEEKCKKAREARAKTWDSEGGRQRWLRPWRSRWPRSQCRSWVWFWRAACSLGQYSKKQQLWSDDDQWCLENAFQ